MIKKALILCYTLLLFWQSTSLAENTVNCPNCTTATPVTDATITLSADLIKPVECMPEERLMELEAKNIYEDVFSNSGINTSQNIHGLSFIGKQKELDILKDLLDPVAPSNLRSLTASCYPKTVLCALSSMYGSKEAAYRVLALAGKTGYLLTLNHHRFVFDKVIYPLAPWSPGEIRSQQKTIMALPENFQNLPTLKNFYNLEEGYAIIGHEDAAAIAKLSANASQTKITGEILFQQKTTTPQKTIAHEIAHHIEYSFMYNDNLVQRAQNLKIFEDFKNLSGWKKRPIPLSGKQLPKDEAYEKNSKAKFVTDYAQKTPSEDWAETLAFYTQNPEVLYLRAPEKYNFVKTHIFNNQEFWPTPDWPALNALIKEKGGESALLFECTKNILNSTPSSAKNTNLMFWEKKHGTKNLTVGYEPQDFIVKTRCLNKIANELKKALAQKDPDFCKYNLQNPIEDTLKSIISPHLSYILNNENEYYKNAQAKRISKCINKKDLRVICLADVSLLVQIDTFPKIKSFNSNSKNKLKLEMLRLLPYPRKKILDHLVNISNPITALANCFANLDMISISKGNTSYWSKIDRDGITLRGGYPHQAKGCGAGLASFFETQGYKLSDEMPPLQNISDTHAQSLFKEYLKDNAMVYYIQGFEEEVLQKWSQAFNLCLKTPCKLKAARELLENWATRHGLPTSSIPPDIENTFINIIKTNGIN